MSGRRRPASHRSHGDTQPVAQLHRPTRVSAGAAVCVALRAYGYDLTRAQRQRLGGRDARARVGHRSARAHNVQKLLGRCLGVPSAGSAPDMIVVGPELHAYQTPGLLSQSFRLSGARDSGRDSALRLTTGEREAD